MLIWLLRILMLYRFLWCVPKRIINKMLSIWTIKAGSVCAVSSFIFLWFFTNDNFLNIFIFRIWLFKSIKLIWISFLSLSWLELIYQISFYFDVRKSQSIFWPFNACLYGAAICSRRKCCLISLLSFLWIASVIWWWKGSWN